MENFYHLTKKELSYISGTQKPIIGANNKRLSSPVVVSIYKLNYTVSRVYTLNRFKRMVKQNEINPELYLYLIRSMI